MPHAILSVSIGCFTGLLCTLLARSRAVSVFVVDAILGGAGGAGMAWFLAPISDNANDPDVLNLAALIGAVFGALVFVALAKAVRGK